MTLAAQQQERQLGTLRKNLGEVESRKNEMSAGVAENAAKLQEVGSDMQGLQAANQVMVEDMQKESESAALGDQDGRMNALEDSMRAGSSLAAKSKDVMTGMEAEFKGKLEQEQEKSEAKASGLTEQVMHLVQNAPNFAAMFKSDTNDASSEINAAHKKIDAAAEYTEMVYKKYEAEIEKLQEDRETRANKLHGSITDFKKKLVGEVEKTVDAIEEMFKDLKASKGRLEAGLKDFEMKLETLNSVSSDTDQKELDELEAGKYTLETQHKRLLSSVSHFFHYDKAYNDEVKTKLKQMGKEVESDEGSEETEEIEQQLAVKDALGSMKKQVKGQIAKAQENGLKGSSNLAAEMAEGVDAVLAKSKSEAKTRENEEENARQQQKRMAMSEAQLLKEIEANEEGLEYQAAQVDKEAKEARAEVESGFALVKETAKADNVKLDERIDDNLYKMQSMAASVGTDQGESFLQE